MDALNYHRDCKNLSTLPNITGAIINGSIGYLCLDGYGFKPPLNSYGGSGINGHIPGDCIKCNDSANVTQPTGGGRNRCYRCRLNAKANDNRAECPCEPQFKDNGTLCLCPKHYSYTAPPDDE